MDYLNGNRQTNYTELNNNKESELSNKETELLINNCDIDTQNQM
jgi:hypothetical protein